MYLQEISGALQGHEVKIKYDCTGSFDLCGQEKMLKLKYAEKNFKDNDGKHICRKCFLKYKNPMKKDEVKEKVKKTCVEKYGNSMPMNNKENIEKRKELFKDEDYKNQWVEKHKKTNLERYGVDHPVKLESVRNKQKQTLRENYGVEYPYQSKEIMDKMKAANLEKYGVENVAELPEVQIKMAQTTLERYGVEHYNELPEMRDYLRENCREWLKESWESGGPMKGITRPEEWNQKARETIANLIAKGEWKGGHKNTWRGRYMSKKCIKQNPMFRSGFELLYHWHLDHNEDVEWYEYEPFYIPYEKEDKTIAFYFPDFLVKFKDKNTMILCEVKADYLHDSLDTKKKYECAKNYVKDIDMEYIIMLKNDIKNLSLNFDEIIKKESVTITNNPRL
jgi:hypothetical protein